MTESELALTEQKAHDFSLLITRLKQELSDKTTVHQDELRKEHEVKHSTDCVRGFITKYMR